MQKILISISIILIIIGIVIVTKKQKNSKNSEVLYIYTVKNGHVRMKKRYLKARTMNDILNSVHYMFDYISSCQERNYIMIDNQPYIFNDNSNIQRNCNVSILERIGKIVKGCKKKVLF